MKTNPTSKHYLEYYALRVVQLTFSIIPLCVAHTLLKGVLWLLFWTIWPLRRETTHRIREVFGPDYPTSKVRKIARRSFFNLAMNFIEMLHVVNVDKEWFKQHVDGLDAVSKAVTDLIDRHGGVVVALPHMGNWELAGMACLTFGIRLMAIARKQSNPLVEGWIQRTRHGNFESVESRATSTLVRIAHHLKNGGAFAILPDVRGKKPDFTTQFLGKEIPINKGMARFARLGNVPILPVSIARTGIAKQSIQALTPVLPDLDQDTTQDLLRMTQAVMTQFDAEIKANPDDWFWYNRRWILSPLHETRRK